MVVVGGGGIAGQSLCETLRERDPDVPITLICGERHLPYDRVNLSDLFAPDTPEGPLGGLQLRPEEWYEDNNVEVLVGTYVERIDVDAHELTLSGGDTRRYGKLALATGSQPLVPPIEGLELENVHVYRGPEDAHAIRAAAAEASRAAVIGGGLLGLEAARGIQYQGCPVTVVHLMNRLMERQLDAQSAEMLLPAMRELDMDVQLERQTSELLGAGGRVRGLRFADGEELEADLVAVSVGIRPETTLASDAGIDCNRGIVVGNRMQTSAADVVAMGEYAEHRGMVYGLVAPIYEHAQVAADTLLDRPGEDYHGSVPWAKLKVAEVDVVSIGDVEGDGGATSARPDYREYRKIGCPRNCAEATVKDIGCVAVEGDWQVYVGGAAGATVRKGDVIATTSTQEEAKRIATAFLQYYREHASFKERTYDFVPRIGLDEVQCEVLGEESQAGLLERFRLAKTAAAGRGPLTGAA